jgi:hypothetical protein
MGTSNWQLVAQLDRVREPQAPWSSGQPDPGQLRLSFDEEGPATVPSDRATPRLLPPSKRCELA